MGGLLGRAGYGGAEGRRRGSTILTLAVLAEASYTRLPVRSADEWLTTMLAANGSKTARPEAEIFADLGNLCASSGYIHAIAFLSFQDNFIRYGETFTAKDLVNHYSPTRLVRTELATLIGLLVKKQIDLTLPPLQTLQAYLEQTHALLEELHRAMIVGWFADINANSPPTSMDVFSRGQNLREPIFYGSESAYSFQYNDLAGEKYKNDNEWLKQEKGFSIYDATTVARCLGTLLPDQALSTLKSLRHTPVRDWTFLPAFEFSAEDIVDKCNVDLSRVRSVLNSFTLLDGNNNQSFTSITEFNHTNALPILKLEQEKYCLFQHYSLLEAIYESPFFWMIADKSYKEVALSNRGLFAESFIYDRLVSVFGTERVFANVEILRSDGSVHGEIDTLVLYGNRAIVVQAKSKRLTIESRKGNDLSLKDDFKKAVQNAYDQAYTCSAALLDKAFALRAADGKDIIRPSSIQASFPLCIVSDHYPALAFQARHFLISHRSEHILNALVTDIFTLDVMTEMLSTPLHFLHYLHLRDRFGERFLTSHDLTLLSYHLAKNLWLDGEFDMVSLEPDISSELDVAMLSRRDGIPGAKVPPGILTRFVGTTFGRLVNEIEASGDPRTTDIGLWLLCLGEQTALDLGNSLDRIAKIARRDRKPHDLTIGVANRASGLTVHCNYLPLETAVPKLLEHAKLRKHSMRASHWHAILINPGDLSVRIGFSADFAWEADDRLDKLLVGMARPLPGHALNSFASGWRNVGRNDPCPCGSGEKYKKCCLPKMSP